MDTNLTVTSKTGAQKIGVPVSSELPKVKDPTINVRDRLNDVLLTEKHNLISYQIGINEVVNDDLRNVVISNRNKIQDMHTRFFNEMFNLGEYQVDIATNIQISDSVQVFNNYKVQLPYKM